MGKICKNIRETHIIGDKCNERFLGLRDSAASQLKSFGITMAGISSLRPPYEMGRLNPQFHLLLFTLKGQGRLKVASEEHHLTEDSLLILPAGSRYTYRIAAAVWKIMWFHLRETRFWKQLPVRDWQIRKSVHSNPILGAMEGILFEQMKEDARSDEVVRLNSQLLLIHLKREAQFCGTNRDLDLDRQFRQLWAEVEQAIGDDWSIARMARYFHLSPGHFHRLTVEHYDVTPMKILERLRMQRVESLLRGTGMTLQEIAPRVGYTNSFALSTAFKRYAGVSPREYRDKSFSDDRSH